MPNCFGHFVFSQKLQQDVSRTIRVAIEHDMAFWTVECLALAQARMQCSTVRTGFAGVGLIDNNDATPRILTSFVEQALTELVVRPGQHCPRHLRADASLDSRDHVAGFK